jgi:orotidine-5'-phosphate decarboxylase
MLTRGGANPLAHARANTSARMLLVAEAQDFHFADALITRVRSLGHPLCVGLDPHLASIPSLFQRGSMQPGARETADAVEAFVLAVVDRLEGRVAVVKPQIAFYEQLGPQGMVVLERVIARSRERGLLVLLDAKRGDIGSTAEAYARAYLDPDAPMRADAITLNAYLGLDSLEPFAARAQTFGAGLFVLVRTSNPGAEDFQQKPSGDVPLFVQMARSLQRMAIELVGKETGWSSLGVVVGATWPEHGRAVRHELPNSLFLVPGYGAQGGTAKDAVKSFVRGPSGLEGGVVNSSRGILFPDAGKADSASAWEQSIDAALDRATTELGEAIR